MAEFLLAKQLGKKIFGVVVEEIPIEDLPTEQTNEWQLCDLVKGNTHIEFSVEREPIVPPTRVELSEAGLNALKQGLRNAGLLSLAARK